MIKFAIKTEEYTHAAPREIVRTSSYDNYGGMTYQPQKGMNKWVSSPQFFTREDAQKVCEQMNEQSKPFAFHKVEVVETSNNLTSEILETINKVIESGEITHLQLMDLIGLTGESAKALEEKARGNFFEHFIAPYCTVETTISATLLRKETSFSIKYNGIKTPLIIDTSNLITSLVCSKLRDMQKEGKFIGYLFNNKFFVIAAGEIK